MGLKKTFAENNLDYNLFLEEVKILLKWQKFIYQFYSNKIEIDESSVEREIQEIIRNNSNLEEFRLSEIEILLKSDETKEKIILDLKLLMEDRGNSKEKLKKILANIKISSNIERCISKSEAILVLTEWDEFKNFDWDYLFNNLENPPFIIDGRNIIRMNKKNNNKLYSIGK